MTIAEIARQTEPNFDLVECFRSDGSNTCPITPICALKDILEEGLKRFVEVLEGYTLADVLENRGQLARTLKIERMDRR